jgi:hypothetical protein
MEVLSRYLLEELIQDIKTLNKDSQWSGRDSN